MELAARKLGKLSAKDKAKVSAEFDAIVDKYREESRPEPARKLTLISSTPSGMSISNYVREKSGVKIPRVHVVEAVRKPSGIGILPKPPESEKSTFIENVVALAQKLAKAL